MLTKLVDRHWLMARCTLLKITSLDRHVRGACIVQGLRCVVRQMLLVSSNGLTIESRLMLLLERIDIREQRRYNVLLLLMIASQSCLSRDVLHRLPDVRLHIGSVWLHLLMAVVGTQANKRKMSITRLAMIHRIKQGLMGWLGRGQCRLILLLDITRRLSLNIGIWYHVFLSRSNFGLVFERPLAAKLLHFGGQHGGSFW